MSTLLILIATITGNYSDKCLDKDTIQNNIFLSNYPVEIVSTILCRLCSLAFFYNNKRLIRHALFIPRVNNVMFSQSTF